MIVIAIGYGVCQGRPHRSKIYEQVAVDKGQKTEWFVKGVEAALLAPTAINQQRFQFVLKEDQKVDLLDLGGPFSKVDKGIVRYHFDVGAGLLQ